MPQFELFCVFTWQLSSLSELVVVTDPKQSLCFCCCFCQLDSTFGCSIAHILLPLSSDSFVQTKAGYVPLPSLHHGSLYSFHSDVCSNLYIYLEYRASDVSFTAFQRLWMSRKFINVYEQYCALWVTVHQSVWAVLCTVSHSPSMCMSCIVHCESQSINVYEQYCALWVTVHQSVWAVLCTVSHSPSMCMSCIVHCESQSINVYEQYCALWVTVHQCVWAVLSTVSHSPSVCMSSIVHCDHSPSMCMSCIVHCESQSINVYEQYCALWVTVHQCVWAVLSTVSHSPSVCMSSIVHCESQSINV